MTKQELRALACKEAVELLGRVNRGADIDIEIVELLMAWPSIVAEREMRIPPAAAERSRSGEGAT